MSNRLGYDVRFMNIGQDQTKSNCVTCVIAFELLKACRNVQQIAPEQPHRIIGDLAYLRSRDEDTTGITEPEYVSSYFQNFEDGISLNDLRCVF